VIGSPGDKHTFDRGTEFAAHGRLHPFRIATYFCNPYSPWQKGAVENLNGRLRRLLPKGRKTYLDQTILDRIARRFNTTPRKCLGFMTPKEALTLHLRKKCCDKT
jgi:IS30 family transposase